VKRLFNTGFAFLLLAAAWPAAAQQPERQRGRAEALREEMHARPPARTAEWPSRADHGEHGDGRMTPEERRQLRRDINAHGRELYRERRGRR